MLQQIEATFVRNSTRVINSVLTWPILDGNLLQMKYKTVNFNEII